METTIKTLATKEDLATGMASVRNEIANLNVSIHKEMGDNKADTIKWMFIFWVGQVAATPAIVLLFLKK